MAIKRYTSAYFHSHVLEGILNRSGSVTRFRSDSDFLMKIATEDPTADDLGNVYENLVPSVDGFLGGQIASSGTSAIGEGPSFVVSSFDFVGAGSMFNMGQQLGLIDCNPNLQAYSFTYYQTFDNQLDLILQLYKEQFNSQGLPLWRPVSKRPMIEIYDGYHKRPILVFNGVFFNYPAPRMNMSSVAPEQFTVQFVYKNIVLL